MYTSAIYQGQVMHHRLRPKVHRFIYRVSACLFNLDELPLLSKAIPCFSYNQFNLWSFYDQDYGDHSKIPLNQQVRTYLKAQGYNLGEGKIFLLCYPRLLGYVFNPLSVYYCYDEAENLKLILYEVSNTFAQKHRYLLQVDTQEIKNTPYIVRQSCNKTFYVSPFIPMQCRYDFRMRLPDEKVLVGIRQHDQAGAFLHAVFQGRRQDFTQANLLRTWMRHPFMTLKVIAGIHWEALRLWRKKVPFYPRPKTAQSGDEK
ncbi:hypothetical protein SAMN05421831_101251 [Allopseudospirillum japonicum]|uniref:DUF1365 domain-containing protein n=1 Tax=Allopseudospirillum japonicum TaxID=64971 RepID=A0A1H6QJT9_9GAMM|nr:DUF1365 domain-containing protein [Allopseudospirillum japonicum]SEI39555.1 hypothetical protein SAMN05421831_101251 [Allopseudospirillum japonicum]